MFEDLRALQQEARSIVGFSQATHQQFASLGGADHPNPLDWLRLARRITTAAGQVDRLVQLRQLDPEVLDTLYRALLEVRDVWTEYAAILCPDIQATPDDPDAQSWHAQPLARITRIIGHLRRLLGG